MTFRSQEDNVYWVDGCKKKDPEEHKNLKYTENLKRCATQLQYFGFFLGGVHAFLPSPISPYLFIFVVKPQYLAFLPWMCKMVESLAGAILGRD